LSAGQINRSKDIFQPGLLGIKSYGEKVFPGIIGHFSDTPEGGDGGAHGVGATASQKPTTLHHAGHPKIYAVEVHGESSLGDVHPASPLNPPGWLR
jgi:hypothetical protein